MILENIAAIINGIVFGIIIAIPTIYFGLGLTFIRW